MGTRTRRDQGRGRCGHETQSSAGAVQQRRPWAGVTSPVDHALRIYMVEGRVIMAGPRSAGGSDYHAELWLLTIAGIHPQDVPEVSSASVNLATETALVRVVLPEAGDYH